MVNRTLYFTLLNNPDPSGSARTIWMFSLFSFKYLETPAIVPPVPAEQTNASRSPFVCL